ncbi:uncharacterized protein A4U43_C05F35640 [Asparagus officinalis]|uniref:Uncharacterized protein n=1 Tax=Asparagus officinalis TaxID=4686 RepID=A0A5P1F2G7_ASPOF|nr:uncharacterized protein A4U43_C05F35640 [Asparagus officinalis]
MRGWGGGGGDVEELESGLLELRYLSFKLIGVKPEEHELGELSEGRRDLPGELVVGDVNLLQRPGPQESPLRDDAGELVVGEVEGLEGAQGSYVGRSHKVCSWSGWRGAGEAAREVSVEVREAHASSCGPHFVLVQ